MKKRVLILYEYNDLGMSDFAHTDYSEIAERVNRECCGKFPNFGNKVWLQGIVSAITTDFCEYEFGYENITPEYANANFDCAVMPLANCFHKTWIPWLKQRGNFVSKMTIPVHVIACGAQADSYEDLDRLVAETREPASYLIKAVLNTGGNIALRGYFTAEYFEKLGFHDYFVTGCPSAFQMGRDLSISNEKAERDVFKAAINGSFHLPLTEKSADRAVFVCQGNYGKMLYDAAYFKENPFDFNRIKKLISRGEFGFVKALAEDRIRMFSDIGDWMSFFAGENISFSFGSRIHGTIMPVLSGVPSVLYATDSRTREMAEFFDIPMLLPENAKKKYDIYDLYLSADYTRFNERFPDRYDDFEKFLVRCGLVEKANGNNIFMKRSAPYVKPAVVNADEIEKLNAYLKKNALVFAALKKYYSAAR